MILLFMHIIKTVKKNSVLTLVLTILKHYYKNVLIQRFESDQRSESVSDQFFTPLSL